MDLTFTNLFQFISIISPFLLGFFLIMISIFNQDIKAFVYLGGILFATIINMFLMNIMKQTSFEEKQPICDLVNMPFGLQQYNAPALNSMYIAFTMAYLFLPMFATNQINYGLISFITILFIIDGVNKVMNLCTNYIGIFTGLFVGLLMGSLWYTIFKSSGNSNLLYFDEVTSNKVYCSKPKKQTFKCSVYKNGELIKTL